MYVYFQSLTDGFLYAILNTSHKYLISNFSEIYFVCFTLNQCALTKTDKYHKYHIISVATRSGIKNYDRGECPQWGYFLWEKGKNIINT